jgi:hypothetical protein
MTDEVNPAKASRPLPTNPTGVLAFQLSIHIDAETGSVRTGWKVGDEAAQAFFVQRFPLAYAMLSSLCRKVEGPMGKLVGEPEQDLDPPGEEEPSG